MFTVCALPLQVTAQGACSSARTVPPARVRWENVTGLTEVRQVSVIPKGVITVGARVTIDALRGHLQMAVQGISPQSESVMHALTPRVNDAFPRVQLDFSDSALIDVTLSDFTPQAYNAGPSSRKSESRFRFGIPTFPLLHRRKIREMMARKRIGIRSLRHFAPAEREKRETCCRLEEVLNR